PHPPAPGLVVVLEVLGVRPVGGGHLVGDVAVAGCRRQRPGGDVAPVEVDGDGDRLGRDARPRGPAVGCHRRHAGRGEPAGHRQPAGGRVARRGRQQRGGGRRPRPAGGSGGDGGRRLLGGGDRAGGERCGSSGRRRGLEGRGGAAPPG